MKTVISPEIKEVLEAIPYRPAISVILPFDPKMKGRVFTEYTVKIAIDRVKDQLRDNYPADICDLALNKLRKITAQLNYNTLKKSVAMFVSPVFEKVLYLDIPVEEKIIVDGSFEIRDLVYSKKELHKYLVLLLSAKEYKIFLGNSSTFVRIVTGMPAAAAAYKNDAPEQVANFSDPADRKEDLMHKFLLHIDKGLHLILNAHPLPLFVMGTERIMGHFKKISRHSNAVIEYINGNYENTSPEELQRMLLPHVANWKKVKESELLHKLETAAGDKTLVTGLKEVWKAATHKKGRLLAVEKNYMAAAELGGEAGEINSLTVPYNKFSYIKDAVDDIIEKVLDNGGDVEFVDPPLLDAHHHIALVTYY